MHKALLLLLVTVGCAACRDPPRATGHAPPPWAFAVNDGVPPADRSEGGRPHQCACGYCHLPSGLGRPENASLAGLPVDYILRQLDDFRSGARRSSEPRSVPANLMVEAANAIDELVRQLYDLRAGKRHGALATLMQPVVTALDDADTVAVAAYLASVTP